MSPITAKRDISSSHYRFTGYTQTGGAPQIQNGALLNKEIFGIYEKN
jgi:hypothetical protein